MGRRRDRKRRAARRPTRPRRACHPPDISEHAKNEKGQDFKAANPALLRVNLFKYFWNFPFPLMMRLGLLAMSLALTLRSCFGLILVLGSGYLLFRHWKLIREKFVSGAICPAKILSVDPPVVAVYCDLAFGGGSCKVIRLLEQPLHKLEPSLVRSRRVATVCQFFGMFPGFSDHWFMPLPTIPELVSNKTNELQRIFDSIPDCHWYELDQGLKQLPPKPELRTYRIIRPEFRPTLQFSSPEELSMLCQSFLPKEDERIGSAITDEVFAHATQFLKKPVDRASVVAIAQSLKAGAIITFDSVTFFYRNDKQQPITIPWSSIKVAYVSMDEMEIITTANERIRVPTGCLIRTMVQLEKLINQAVGVGPED